jgi:rRNA maturation protein Nop10
MEKKKKRYTVKTGCPQCGCTQTTVMSEKELKER